MSSKFRKKKSQLGAATHKRYWAELLALLIAVGTVVSNHPACAQEDPPPKANESESETGRRTPEMIIASILAGAPEQPAQQIQDAKAALAALQGRNETDEVLLAKACLAVSMASYIDGQPAVALENLKPCVSDQIKSLDPSLYIRARSYLAGLMILNGDREGSLAVYEEALSVDKSALEPAAMRRVRANYATVLFEAGRVMQAIEEMQSVVQESRETGDYDLMVGLGNNLIIVLIEQRLYGAAEAWLDRLAPAIEQVQDRYTIVSLDLHRLQLKALLGEPEAAVEGLTSFLESYTSENAGTIAYGSAHEFLAQALLETGHPEQALEAASRAVALLEDVPVEQIDARLMLAKAYNANGLFEPALAEVAIVEAAPLVTPIRDEVAQATRLVAELGLAGNAEGSRRFQQYLLASAKREATAIVKNTRYFDAMLRTRQQETEIERINQNQALLAAETAASKARASEMEARSEADRRIRNLVILVGLLVASGVFLFFYGWTQRRFERRLRLQEKALNETLSELVDEKSTALQIQLEEQTALERQLSKNAETEAIGRLTGNVAHDFNNLLQVISIANEQLEQAIQDKPAAMMLSSSNQALDHAKSIVRQLLAFARKQRLEAAPLVFSEYLNDTRTLLAASLDEKVTLTVNDRSAGASAKLDASQLTTALLNLLSNACDAMPDGGEVRLQAALERLQSSPDCWSELTPGEYLVIRLTDNGTGMTEEELERACEPFFSTKDEQAGTGLGLSSVYGFVRQSRGDMQIRSAPGIGASIIMAFPLTEGSSENTVPMEKIPERLDGLTLLLVEDNAILARTLKAMIRYLGAEIIHCENGDDALERIAHHDDYDIVLSDIRMPGKHDGVALYQWMAQNRPHKPILLMSGFNDSLTAGDDKDIPVLSKPFGQHELVRAIRSKIPM